MISYREKQLLAVQKMLQDDTTKMLEETINILDKINSKEHIESSVNIFDETIKDYNGLVELAQEKGYSYYLRVTDILSQEELDDIDRRKEEIEKQFSKKTSIINKTDLIFLAIATALQVTKSLVFPYVAENFEYGESFDPSTRKAHDDPSIKKEHKEANDKFKNKHIHKGKGYWINMLYQTVPYDITKGSADLGINMGGKYHRMYTLGHDPILGWLFGTANILTDCITFNTMKTNRISRIDPITGGKKMVITPATVSIGEMFSECFEMIKADKMNLPAALFTQAQHYISDKDTKLGLPVPLLSKFNENFESKLYSEHYDAICFARDAKIVGASLIVSRVFDMIIGLVHGFYREENENKDLYEVRTKKILLISNSIASTSTIINAAITKDIKKLDIGTLLNTVIHLFTDTRFILKIKDEFIRSSIDKDFESKLSELEKEIEFLELIG